MGTADQSGGRFGVVAGCCSNGVSGCGSLQSVSFAAFALLTRGTRQCSTALSLSAISGGLGPVPGPVSFVVLFVEIPEPLPQ